jgi:predicted permease
MLHLPDSVENTHSVAFAVYATYVLLLNVGFFVSLIVWTLRTRNALVNAFGFLLSHTIVGAIALPIVLSEYGDKRFYYSMALWLIDFPILIAFGYIFELRSRLHSSCLYLLLGGGVYWIIGFLIGIIASFVRRLRKYS